MILRHRDRELLRFEWNGLEGVRIVSVNEAENITSDKVIDKILAEVPVP